MTPAFCLPSVTDTPCLLKEADVALSRGKSIQLERVLLVTAGFEGSNRKCVAHSASEPDSA